MMVRLLNVTFYIIINNTMWDYRFEIYTNELWVCTVWNDDWALDLDKEFIEVYSVLYDAKIHIRPSIILWYRKTHFITTKNDNENNKDISKR